MYNEIEYQRGYEQGIRGAYCPCGCSADYADGWYDGACERDGMSDDDYPGNETRLAGGTC